MAKRKKKRPVFGTFKIASFKLVEVKRKPQTIMLTLQAEKKQPRKVVRLAVKKTEDPPAMRRGVSLEPKPSKE